MQRSQDELEELRSQMAAKEIKINQLLERLEHLSVSNSSLISENLTESTDDSPIDGVLSLPSKLSKSQNTRRREHYVWKEYCVLLTSRNLFFFASEHDKILHNPYFTLDVE